MAAENASSNQSLGAVILRMYDRQHAIHKRLCNRRPIDSDARHAAFTRRIDHIEAVMLEMLPRWFPEFYR